MRIVIFLYDGMTALDAVGPYEVLSCMSDAEVVFASERAGPVRMDSGQLALVADQAIDEVTAADILLIPGGPGDEAVMENQRVLEWVRRIHEITTYTTSVCTGALILGAAGVLEGKAATTYWSRVGWLSRFGATARNRRFVVDGKVWTAAGVSAGIDMALALLAAIKGKAAARAIRMGIEYYPRPPVWSPLPSWLPKGVHAKLSQQVEAFMKRRMERRQETQETRH